MKHAITIHTNVDAPLENVWSCYTNPEHVIKWNQASPDWHSPWGKNDLRTGGEFVYRMESKDGKQGFDFGGKYDEVREHELIAYTMGDERKVSVEFEPYHGKIRVTVTFEPETMNPVEFQQAGWQSILDSFKKHTEECK